MLEVPVVGKVLSKTQCGEEEFPCPGMEAEAKGLLGKQHRGQEPAGKPGPAGYLGRNGVQHPVATLARFQLSKPRFLQESKPRFLQEEHFPNGTRRMEAKFRRSGDPWGQAAHPGPVHHRDCCTAGRTQGAAKPAQTH